MANRIDTPRHGGHAVVDDRVKLRNAAGTTHAIADVAGWFNDGGS